MADEQIAENPAEETPATPSPEPQTPPAEPEADPPAEPVAETPEPAPEPTPEPTPTPPAAEGRPGWDKDRQKRDEERARREKERDEEVASLKRTVEELTKAKTPPAPPPPTPDELAAMADQIADLRNPLSDKFNEEEAAKLDATWRKATVERQRTIDQRLKQREDQDAAAAAHESYWRTWQSEHPDHDPAKAQALADEIYAKYSSAYRGDVLKGVATEEFKRRVDEAKKVKPAAPRPSAAPKTAPPASVSAPAGTRVIPKDTGARQQPAQLKDAADVLVAHMNALRNGG